MSYRNILEQYMKNELSEEKMKQVKADIEQQEAISEFLLEQEEVGQVGVFEHISEDGDAEAKVFAKNVQQAIHQAFVKVGILVGGITIVVVLFILFGLPRIVSSFYYNPGAKVSVQEEVNSSSQDTWEQMSLDMMIYTDVFMPYNPRQSVEVLENGYGSYDVNIGSFFYQDDRYEEVVGRINQNELWLYNPSAFKQMPGNAFGWFQQTPTMETSLRDIVKEDVYDAEAGGYVNTYMAASGSREQASETLESLQENKKYVAYVTLDQLMKYEDFMKLTEKYEDFHPGWVSVVYSELNGVDMIQSGEFGFSPSASASSFIYWDEEKYPELWTFTSKYFEENSEEHVSRTHSEEYMATHFTSMLSYLEDQKEFCDMMKVEMEALQTVKEYVQEQGIIVQGFAIMGTKDELLRINDMEEVYAMYVER